jgi:hypothetical protein
MQEELAAKDTIINDRENQIAVMKRKFKRE